MDDPGESPFRRDEPVSTSSLWVWMAVAGLGGLVMLTLGNRITQLSSVRELPSLLFGVVLQGGLVWLLFRAARATSACRERRNFECMARALRAQRRFWIFLTIFTLLTVIALLGVYILVKEDVQMLQLLHERTVEKQQGTFEHESF